LQSFHILNNSLILQLKKNFNFPPTSVIYFITFFLLLLINFPFFIEKKKRTALSPVKNFPHLHS
jgi:hypothetical protein